MKSIAIFEVTLPSYNDYETHIRMPKSCIKINSGELIFYYIILERVD